jgi:hypothetical protein
MKLHWIVLQMERMNIQLALNVTATGMKIQFTPAMIVNSKFHYQNRPLAATAARS